jgi:transposase-like protein
MARARVDRDEWRRRIERWKDSGLTAKEFAAETGINASTLQFWRYQLKRPMPVSGRRRAPSDTAGLLSSIVEVRPPATAGDTRFEVELANGRRLRVPAVYEASALRTLLAVLEAAA